ncbi:MAG: threonine/serine exporter family protein, partial [Clostridia bacterium]|nr:threonine/serine exporter family protein [Clostridia bacterium]
PASEADLYANRLLCLALDIGESLLKSGAEIHRVENTVERICHAYGAVHVEVFAITSLVMASVRMKDNGYSSQIRRVYSSTNRLACLEHFNNLSREICRNTPPLDEADRMIREAQKYKKYPFWVFLLGCGVAAGMFTVFFGGNILDALLATVLGCFVAVLEQIHSAYINQLAKLMITSFMVGCLANLGVWLGFGAHADAVIIGTIMLLIPGLAFGNAIRDLLCGDILAGILKTVQSCLSAVLIAFGFMLATLFMGELGIVTAGGVLSHPLPVRLITAVFSTLGFMGLFRSKLKNLPVVAVCALFVYWIYDYSCFLGFSPFIAAFFASVFNSAFSEISARVFHAPALVYSSLGAISIVPGSSLYYTMNALLFDKSELIRHHFGETLLISAGIALGTVLVLLLTTILTRFGEKRREKKTKAKK